MTRSPTVAHERSIRLTAAQVRAVLDGTKTQHRQVLRPASVSREWPGTMWPSFLGGKRIGESNADPEIVALPAENGGVIWAGPTPICPGYRLWVRETWAHYHTVNHVRRSHGGAFDEVSDGLAGYRADGHDSIEDFREHVRLMSGCDLEAVIINGDRWRPSIHMPRWASRITLEVTEVRVQRLQDISEEDARAEGALLPWTGSAGSACDDTRSPRDEFQALWTSINGPGSWDANPWCVAITFRRIDQAGGHYAA